jgi:hypothetical protein
VLLDHPSPKAWGYGAIRLGRLTDEAEIVVAEQALDVALLHEVSTATVQTSIDRAVDRRGWRTWYRQHGDSLAPTLRQAIAPVLEETSMPTAQRLQGDGGLETLRRLVRHQGSPGPNFSEELPWRTLRITMS